MSFDEIPVDVPHRHVEGGFPSDWMAVRANGEVVVIHEPGDSGTTAYTLGEPTKNPRTMAGADAVMWEGAIGRTSYDDGLLIIQHPFAGVQERLPIAVLLDENVPTLERTDLVALEGAD